MHVKLLLSEAFFSAQNEEILLSRRARTRWGAIRALPKTP